MPTPCYVEFENTASSSDQPDLSALSNGSCQLSTIQGLKDQVQSVGMTNDISKSTACVEPETERTSSFILQLATSELSFKEQQGQDPVLKEVVSWKLKGRKPPYRKMNRWSSEERIL